MGRTIVIVNDAAIASLFDEGSEIGRLTGRISREARLTAVASAPRRTGMLSASVRSYANRHYTYGRRMAVYSDLFYARFVEHGTRGPIRPKFANWLRVPKYPGSYRYTFKRAVRGQDANPFMARAMEHACDIRGLLVYLD